MKIVAHQRHRRRLTRSTPGRAQARPQGQVDGQISIDSTGVAERIGPMLDEPAHAGAGHPQPDGSYANSSTSALAAFSPAWCRSRRSRRFYDLGVVAAAMFAHVRAPGVGGPRAGGRSPAPRFPGRRDDRAADGTGTGEHRFQRRTVAGRGPRAAAPTDLRKTAPAFPAPHRGW